MKGGAFSGNTATLDPYFPLHCLDQAARDIETQAGTTYGAINVSFQAHKTLKDACLMLRRNAQASIPHADNDITSVIKDGTCSEDNR